MLLDLIKLKDKYGMDIKGVFHIGAHFGQENSTYKDLGIKYKVFFEALPHTFEKLIKNIDGDGECVNIALGNTIGEVEMHVESANEGQSSSILKPALHTKQYPHIVFEGKVTVPITRLDDYAKENLEISKYNFMNIDVQGYELEVLLGAEETLNEIDYILCEVNRDVVYHQCAMVDDIDNYLKKYNFERVETSWAGGTWGDALYIKRS